MDTNICAFCGTDVKHGFSVCSGCGATYQSPGDLRLRALGIAALGIGAFLIACLEEDPLVLLAGTAIAIAFGFIGFVEFRKAELGAWRRARTDR